MIITKEEDRKKALKAGERLRAVLDAVEKKIQPGITTKDLDEYAHKIITDNNDIPAFLGYKPAGMDKGYPATLCTSINNEIVHGVPKKETVIKEGDVISVDCGLQHEGIFVDAAYTIIVGNTKDERAKKLIEATKKALRYALVFARAGAKVGDIGSAIETVANEYEYTIPPELGGHGVGSAQHEEPFIPNIGDPGTGDTLKKGQMISIEPIFFEGMDPRIDKAGDGFTYKTADKSRAAHFEHTLIIEEGAPTVVTGPMW